MKIRAHEYCTGHWDAVDDDTYDGPGSIVGRGNSRQEAVNDLKEQLMEKRELESLLINDIRKEILTVALDHWIGDTELEYNNPEGTYTEDEMATMANQIAEAEELYEELTGVPWKAAGAKKEPSLSDPLPAELTGPDVDQAKEEINAWLRKNKE